MKVLWTISKAKVLAVIVWNLFFLFWEKLWLVLHLRPCFCSRNLWICRYAYFCFLYLTNFLLDGLWVLSEIAQFFECTPFLRRFHHHWLLNLLLLLRLILLLLWIAAKVDQIPKSLITLHSLLWRSIFRVGRYFHLFLFWNHLLVRFLRSLRHLHQIIYLSLWHCIRLRLFFLFFSLWWESLSVLLCFEWEWIVLLSLFRFSLFIAYT